MIIKLFFINRQKKNLESKCMEELQVIQNNLCFVFSKSNLLETNISNNIFQIEILKLVTMVLNRF